MIWTGVLAPLASAFDRTAALVPAADVAFGSDDLVFTLDVPGMTPDDLTIEVQDGCLSVRGERPRPAAAEGATYVRAERPCGAFERRFLLPEGTDPEAIVASVQNGVLSLIVPKPERVKPRAIPIGARRADREGAIDEQRELEGAAA